MIKGNDKEAAEAVTTTKRGNRQRNKEQMRRMLEVNEHCTASNGMGQWLKNPQINKSKSNILTDAACVRHILPLFTPLWCQLCPGCGSQRLALVIFVRHQKDLSHTVHMNCYYTT